MWIFLKLIIRRLSKEIIIVLIITRINVVSKIIIITMSMIIRIRIAVIAFDALIA